MIISFHGRTRALTAVVVGLCLAFSACRRNPEIRKQQFVKRGDDFAAAGKLAEAIVEYRNAVQLDAKAGDVRVKLADAYRRGGDLQDAVGEYVRAADLLPTDPKVQLAAGDLLLLGGRYDDAKVRAEKTLELNAGNVQAQILLANALAGLKNLDAAVAEIDEAIRLDPERGLTYSNLGAFELSRGNKSTAETAFKKAVELAPTSAPAHLALANFYWVGARWSDAETELKKAAAAEPASAMAHHALANFYLATNRSADAEEHLKKVFELTRSPGAALALADYYVARQDDPSARAVLQPLLADQKTAPWGNVRLAALDYRSGHGDEAFRRLEAVLQKDPDNLQALVLKTALLVDDRKSQAAVANATLTTDKHPDSAIAFFTLGRVQAARHEQRAAAAAFEEALKLNPRATDAKVALARLDLAEGRPEASINLAEEVLSQKPEHGDARLVLVRALLARGDLDGAQQELTRLLARFPKSAAVHVQQGFVLTRRRDASGARQEFERGRQLDPSSIEAIAGLVALDLNARDYASARRRVDERLASKGDDPSILLLAARTYAAGGDKEAAERFLLKAIQIDSGDLPAYGALGQLYFSEGRLDVARQQFEAIAARSPRPVAALTMAGMIWQAQGNREAAKDAFERVMRLDGNAPVAANNLAWIYAESGGNLDLALQLAQIAKSRLPGVAEVDDTLGFIYYKKELTSLAISTLRLSVEKDPANATYQYHLGLAHAQAGDVAQARADLGRALRLKPDFKAAQVAFDELGPAAQR